MRISDWSSDVCSSDLPGEQREMQRVARGIERDGTLADLFLRQGHGGAIAEPGAFHPVGGERDLGRRTAAAGEDQARASRDAQRRAQIGRASCRERGWQYV